MILPDLGDTKIGNVCYCVLGDVLDKSVFCHVFPNPW